MKKTLCIEGLDCAACAAELEEELSKIKGISSASVSFVAQKIFLEYESEEALAKAIAAANRFEEVKVLPDENQAAAPAGGKTSLTIEGLDCAACAAELEEELSKIKGISSVSVSFVMQKIALEYADEEALEKAIAAANNFEEVKVLADGRGNVYAKNGEKDSGAAGERIVLKIANLHCAGCAAELEEILKKHEGLSGVSVDFVGQKIAFTAKDKAAVKKAIEAADKFEKVHVLNAEEALGEGRNAEDTKKNAKKSAFAENKKQLIPIVFSAVFFLAGVLLAKLFDFTATRVISYACYAVAYFSVGRSVLVSTAKNIAKGRIFDENFLMTIASVGAVLLGDYAEGVAVMLLYQLGEWLQAVAVGSSRRSVTDLMALKSESANLVKTGENGEEETEIVAPEKLKVGDVVLVRAGEKIPCDGVVVSEKAALDTKSLTGEAEIRTLKTGEEALSGCINAGGVFRMRITKEYKDSAVKRILDLMENSTAQKAQSEKFITKFSRYYTPIVCISALAVAFLLPLIDVFKGASYFTNFARWTSAALNFLVISCPCALIISVPLTYFCGLGACAREGVLVKGSTYLDALAKAEIIALDKTGTLTKGDFSVTKVHENAPFTAREVLAFAAAAEKNSTHPLAKAFAAAGSAEEDAKAYAALSAEEIAGNGIKAALKDKEGNTYEVLCGKAAFLKNEGVDVTETQSVCTVVYVSVNGKFAGCAEIGDSLRPTAKSAIRELKETGVKKAVMLTGDSAGRAESVAKEAGLDEWRAGLLPDDKLTAAEELKKEGTLVYVGDGINDAPVMACADCAVSMGKLGAAAAVEASDLVLISDDLSALAEGRKTARKTQKIVKQNIAFSIFCKVAFLIGSIAGLIPLWLAVFADVGVMMLAVLNALRMSREGLKKKAEKSGEKA